MCVEADPNLAEEIRENAATNPTLPRIEDVAPLVVRCHEPDLHFNAEIVSCWDTLANRHFVPDIIKLDIEGGEVEALRGASQVLAQRRPAIQLEVHGKEVEWECLSLLRDAGYDPPTVVDRRRWLPEHRPIDHNRWLIGN